MSQTLSLLWNITDTSCVISPQFYAISFDVFFCKYNKKITCTCWFSRLGSLSSKASWPLSDLALIVRTSVTKFSGAPRSRMPTGVRTETGSRSTGTGSRSTGTGSLWTEPGWRTVTALWAQARHCRDEVRVRAASGPRCTSSNATVNVFVPFTRTLGS